jgi:hypothetical protein
MIPQIIALCLIGLALVTIIAKDRQKRDDWDWRDMLITITMLIIWFLLLLWGGFWNKIF